MFLNRNTLYICNDLVSVDEIPELGCEKPRENFARYERKMCASRRVGQPVDAVWDVEFSAHHKPKRQRCQRTN